MDFPFLKIAKDEKETRKIALEFSKRLKIGDLVLLYGDLGAGKTLFVKSVCESFNINYVTSPTFSIVNEYIGKKKVYHIDFYRLNKVEELNGIGIGEYLSDLDAIKFVEWADMFPEIFSEDRYEIRIDYIKLDQRKISITKYG